MQSTRKQKPVFSGVLKYFPDAIMEVARCSWAGNQQHHPEKPLHWDRGKSNDHLDALARHLIQAGEIDDDGVRHSAKVAWRALANLQLELEKAEQDAIIKTKSWRDSKRLYASLQSRRNYASGVPKRATAFSRLLCPMERQK